MIKIKIMTHYKIQSGDTLSAIAKRYGISIDAIMEANKDNTAIKTKDLIYAGKTITIPKTKVAPEKEPKKVKEEIKPYWQTEAERLEATGETDGAQWVRIHRPSGSGYKISAKELKPEPSEKPKKPEEEPLVEPKDIVNPITDDKGDLIIPDELKDDLYIMQLDDDMKAMAIYSWNIAQAAKTASENEIKAYQDAFLEAIEEAEKTAQPYWTEQLSIIKTEFKRGIGILSEDLASVEKDIATRRMRIDEDLKYNKDQLSIEQQAELSRQKKQYDYQLKGVREQMASRGLSFSSIRSEAEEKTKEAHEDIIESSARQYKRQLRALETGTQRGLEDLVTQLSEAKRKTEEAKTSATRGVETQIGSELLDLPETEKLEIGGIYGEPWKSAKQSDIYTRALEQMQLSYPNL